MSFYTRKTIPSGKAGTHKWREKYGEALVCVRYKYDSQNKRRQKTIELVVEEGPWEKDDSRVPANKLIEVRIGPQEIHLQNSVRSLGGIWNPHRLLWRIRYCEAVNLGLEDRIVDQNGEQ